MLEQNGTELSEREKEILKLVATGASNKEIAQQLVISPNTVKVHLRNIFAKISVASRTEATLYAIRTGLVQVAVPSDGQIDEEDITPEAGEAVGKIEPSTALPTRQPRPRWQWIGGTIFAVALIGVLVATWPVWLPSFVPSPTQGVVTAPPRWQSRADMPTARAGLAAVTFDNQIYAIAGEGVDGPMSVVERYDPESDTWQSLTDKPTAVADVQAAVIGGKIYVPGGRLASGEVTAKLEVYDPASDRWEDRADLPVALSAYALTAFEGKLYLFGGWGGKSYTAAVYTYDPASDKWGARTPMPTAKGLAGAAAAGSRIHVIGGVDHAGASPLNLEYHPNIDNDPPASQAWQPRAPLPEGWQSMGVAAVADLVIVLSGDAQGSLTPLQYVPAQDLWSKPSDLSLDTTENLWRPTLSTVGTQVYVLGGQSDDQFSKANTAYQVLFTVAIPVIQQ